MPGGVKVFLCGIIILSVLLFTSCGKDEQDVAFQEADDEILTEKSDNEIDDNASDDKTKEQDTKDILDEEADKPQEVVFNFPEKNVRPYAVMIDNEGTRPLPQGGLDKAQIVYEIVAEGGTTRLMPVFWNENPEMIGPVRSARHYFIDYAMEHDAIYIHFGWSPMAQNDISKFGINNANGVSNGGEIFWDITDDPGNWQDSYTSMKNILAYVDRVGYRKDTEKPLVFEYHQQDKEIADGNKAEKIYIEYSYYTCDYEYNEDTQLYERKRDGKPHMERVSESQFTAKNVIVQYVNSYTIKGDAYGRQNLDNVGTGTGYYITNGQAIDINWSKQSRSSATVYTDDNGSSLVLNPGQTWVQIVPLHAAVKIE